jgi:phage baseplate assembly protein W
MAFNPQQRFPNDLNENRAIGVDLPFNGPGVFSSNYQTRRAIKNNLINYLLTNPGERPSNPTFGAGLRRYIFDTIQSGNLSFIKEDIQQKILSNFPTVVINLIEVLGQEDFNTINIIIKYRIVNTGINDELQINFA